MCAHYMHYVLSTTSIQLYRLTSQSYIHYKRTLYLLHAYPVQASGSNLKQKIRYDDN